MAVLRRRRAGAIVLDGDHVLVMGQTDAAGLRWFHLPGGGVEGDESIEAAVLRELHEETGLVGRCGAEVLRVAHGGTRHRYHLVHCDDLTLGPVSGPEVHELGPEVGFAAEWMAVADLARVPFWPRAAAERVAQHHADPTQAHDLDEVEDERMSWEGVAPTGYQPRHRAVAVIVDDGHLVVVHRAHPGGEGEAWAVLPGGGVEPGETVQEACARECVEELGLEVAVGSRLAVVQLQGPDGRSTRQTYLWCTLTGGALGTGADPELQEHPTATRRRFHPGSVPLGDLAALPLRPTWLAEHLPAWMADPTPPTPDRFWETP